MAYEREENYIFISVMFNSQLTTDLTHERHRAKVNSLGCQIVILWITHEEDDKTEINLTTFRTFTKLVWPFVCKTKKHYMKSTFYNLHYFQELYGTY